MELEKLLHRVREEFREMPGCGSRRRRPDGCGDSRQEICRQVIESLVATAFLRWTASGAVTRAGG